MPGDKRGQARVLIIDDVPANVLLLDMLLSQAGYLHVRGITDARAAVDTFDEFCPDLLLLDLHMPHADGIEVMRRLGDRIAAGEVPVLVLTADDTTAMKREALAAGATDFLTKPFDETEVLLRIANLLEIRFLQLSARDENRRLESRVHERTVDLERAQFEILERLARAAEYRDDATHQHTARVGYTTALIAEELGVSDGLLQIIRRAAPLHDIGKIGIPDGVLLKAGSLGLAEFEIMKTHTTIGATILSGGNSAFVQTAEVIALSHHERWDGTGYPEFRRGEEIPIEARLVAVADAYDALTHSRPYKDAIVVEQALEEIHRHAGRQFDPEVVRAFLSIAGSHPVPGRATVSITLP
ncbi:MAG: HD domain-containing phosphohydrolase [Actinomycetota bacterium]|nr:response regulator [Actinomycetota bacterium]